MLDPRQSLYLRIGGTDAIAAFVDDLLPRLTGDPQLGVYWRGKCNDSKRRDRQLLVDYLGAALGGPAYYTGRDMKTSHAGLNINTSDWQAFVGHVTAALADLGVAEVETAEVLTFLDGLSADIVETGIEAGHDAKA